MEKNAAPEKMPGDDDKKLFIFVDGEKFSPPSPTMTPHQIIDQATDLDPTTHYLLKTKGNDQTSYEGKGETPIALEKADKFQVVSTGPTTVS